MKTVGKYDRISFNDDVYASCWDDNFNFNNNE